MTETKIGRKEGGIKERGKETLKSQIEMKKDDDDEDLLGLPFQGVKD